MNKENISLVKQITTLIGIAACFALPGIIHGATVSNPWIWSDVPDPSIARGEGDNFYMVSTTMHYAPGVPIMKSTDLANWQTVNYAYETLINNDNMNLNNGQNAYGKGSWASSIRYFKGKWYILTPSYTSNKTHLYITSDIENGPFEEKQLPFYHDPSIFFEDDGTGYVIYGGGQISIVKLKSDLSGPDGGSTVLVSETTRNQATGTSSYIVALEGAHMEKVDGKYYLFGISWFGPCRTALVFRSDRLTSGFSGKIFLQNNGVAQGSIFNTAAGKWYAYLFRDSGGVGRIPYLMEVEWKDGWPSVVGGKAPATLNLPEAVNPGYNMVTSDDFDGPDLPLEWQWNHNPDNSKWALKDGKLRITTGRTDKVINTAKNTLTQRTYGPKCVGRTLVSGKGMKDGDIAGLVALADSLGFVALQKSGGSFNVVYYERDTRHASEPLSGDEVYLRIDFNFQNQADKANFYYSTDGNTWKKIGKELKLPYTLGMFVGYRFGLFNYATQTAGGYAEFDWFKVGDDENDEIYLDGMGGDPVPQEPYTTRAGDISLLKKIEAEDFDIAGKGKGNKSFSDNDSDNKGDSDYRRDDAAAVDLYKKGTGVVLGMTLEGEWLEYTVDVPKDGIYTVFTNVSSAGEGASIQYLMDESEITDVINIPQTCEDWENCEFKNVRAVTTKLTAGKHLLRLAIMSNYVDVDYFQFYEGEVKDEPIGIKPVISGKVDLSAMEREGKVQYFDLQGHRVNKVVMKAGVYLVKTPMGSFLKRVEK